MPTIVIAGEIDTDKAGIVLSHIADLKQTGAPPICVQILSPGGEAPAGFAIYDALVNYPGPVQTEVWGECGSIAAIIFQAGDLRTMAPRSEMLIHNARLVPGGAPAGANELKDQSAMTRKMDAMYQQVLHERTGQSLKRIQAWCKREKTFTPDEAMEFGFADEVLPSFRSEVMDEVVEQTGNVKEGAQVPAPPNTLCLIDGGSGGCDE